MHKLVQIHHNQARKLHYYSKQLSVLEAMDQESILDSGQDSIE